MDNEEIDIETILFPDSGVLKENDGLLSCQIIDAELDPLECSFNYDYCVEIKTADYEYITLTLENLALLFNMVSEAEERYREASQISQEVETRKKPVNP